MTYHRRRWLMRTFGATSVFAFWVRSVLGQQQGPVPKCSGVISDPTGKPISNVVVEATASNGLSSKSKPSDGQGFFELDAPKAPYTVIFREQQGNTRLHELSQLTGGPDQKLSVTLDPNVEGFSALYHALQAVEAITAQMASDEKLAMLLLERNSIVELNNSINSALTNLKNLKLTERQMQFLNTKADLVRKQVSLFG